MRRFLTPCAFQLDTELDIIDPFLVGYTAHYPTSIHGPVIAWTYPTPLAPTSRTAVPPTVPLVHSYSTHKQETKDYSYNPHSLIPPIATAQSSYNHSLPVTHNVPSLTLASSCPCTHSSRGSRLLFHPCCCSFCAQKHHTVDDSTTFGLFSPIVRDLALFSITLGSSPAYIRPQSRASSLSALTSRYTYPDARHSLQLPLFDLPRSVPLTSHGACHHRPSLPPGYVIEGALSRPLPL